MKPVMYKLEGLLGEDIPGLYYGIYGKPWNTWSVY
jgi:hypothetical protein